MNVGIVARLLADGSMRGWNRYAVNLVASLARTRVVDIFLLTDMPVAREHRIIFESDDIKNRIKTFESGPMAYPKWQENWLSSVARRERLDILHTPFHFGLPLFSPCPTVATLHDCIDVLEKRSFSERLSPKSNLGRFYLWETRIRAKRIITVSDFSRRELVEKLGVKKQKIRVIHEAADRAFHRDYFDEQLHQEVRSRYGINSKNYLFYVGGLESRKNMGLAIDALARVKERTSLEFVLSGGSADDREKLAKFARSLEIDSRVHFTGSVPDADLPALYSGAAALVYPSRLEGFGLQLVEAMAAGCPILASNVTSLPEVLGDGGELFSPDDADQLAALFLKLDIDPAWRAQLAERACRRSHDFSWENTAAETLSLYREMALPKQ